MQILITEKTKIYYRFIQAGTVFNTWTQKKDITRKIMTSEQKLCLIKFCYTKFI